MPSLRGLKLKAVYQSDDDDLMRDFYVPALAVSQRYDRAVGFFSGAMLSYAAQGIASFVHNGGTMRLIVGAALDEEDASAVDAGYDLRALQERVGRTLVKVIDEVDDDLFRARLELLSWLVASSRLEIKIALKRRGMFHAKVGIMTDAADDSIVFQGSANETAYALLPDFNFESIDVFPSWRREFSDHFEPHVRTFGRLWDNRSPGTLVIPFPDAPRDRMVGIAKQVRVASPALEDALWQATLDRYAPARPSGQRPRLPAAMGGREFAVMPHQRAALQAWKARGWQGILALATGAGKTVTAIYAAVRVFDSLRPLCVVVAVPYQNLADQWIENLRAFDVGAFACYGGVGRWRERVEQALQLHRGGAWPFLCLVVVNRTLQGQPFQSVLARLEGERLMWIGDECHHHASAGIAAALPQHAAMRLGLSATPDHYLDGDANARLAGYYGPTVSTFGLAEALEQGVLTPYRYSVHLVDLTETEAEAYAVLTDRIAALSKGSRSLDQAASDGRLERLLFERARLLGGAANKLAVLDRLLSTVRPSPHALFYCSDASVPVGDEADLPDDDDWDASPVRQRQVEAVSELLHGRGWRNARFTAREGAQERRMILDGFRIGDIDALVAIRCLDEGIDVPACRSAYILASSRNPRQFIQRRGRVLRRAPGKDVADIVDLMVRIPEGIVEQSSLERSLLAGELKRVAEFARLARNAGEVIEALSPMLERYDLLHHLA